MALRQRSYRQVDRRASLPLVSFHPEMVLLPNLYVKLRAFLCDVLRYVSA